LSSYVHGANEELVIDLILKTDRLSADVIDSLRNARLHPPRVGKRHLISYPHLFVSYSRADLERTRSVRSQLHNDGFTTWIDERLEPGTPDWQEAIETAIRESGGVVVLLTPAAKNSTWVDQEIDLAVRFGKRLFPVLLTGDDTTAVPPKLAKIQRVDITNNRLDELVALGGAIRRHLSSHARQSAGDTE